MHPEAIYLRTMDGPRMTKQLLLFSTQFNCHTDHRTGKLYKLTSLANLRHASGGNPFKAYGWSKDDKMITFVYNQGENFDIANFFTFARPKLVSEPTNDVEKKNKKPLWKYKLTSEPGRKRLDDINACMDKNNGYFLLNTCLHQLKLM